MATTTRHLFNVTYRPNNYGTDTKTKQVSASTVPSACAILEQHLRKSFTSSPTIVTVDRIYTDIIQETR